MRAKRRFGLLLVAVMAPLAFAGAHSIQPVFAQKDDDALEARIEQDYSKAVVAVKENYAGDVDDDKVVKAAILGMLHTLDPHSSYLDRKEWSTFQNEQRSRYSGIGSTIAQRNGNVYIMSPFDGTPAFKGGIRYGDKILEINGESAEGWNSQQVSNKLLGPEGTTVIVKVARVGASQPVEFRFKRDTVPLPSIANSFMLGKGIGYINLSRGFNTTTAREVEEALADLHGQGMTSLVLDLRNNRGGLVDQAGKVVNDFIYRGQKIVSVRGRPSVFPNRDMTANSTTPDESPMVVLINRGTASAAEIVAGALQDHDRARTVGVSSFGKGLVQSVYTLRDGSGLTLTAAKYYTPSGRLIQRDYSNRSFYDYYLARGDKAATQKAEVRYTDTGRPVYGGDGIAPDVEVKVPVHDLELQRVWLEPVFTFATYLVAGQVPGIAGFTVGHPADHTHRLAATEYVVNDKVVAAFKAFIHSHPELKANEARVDQDAAYIKQEIRYEVVTAAYGQETAYQVLLEGDAQMQRALAELPKARAMADDMRRAWTASHGAMRRE